MRTYQQLKSATEAKGYNFFDTGIYNINIIFERVTETITNKFDDIMNIAFRDEAGAEQVLSIPATTKPGLYGPGAIENPKPNGTAILPPGQYKHTWQFIDTNQGKGHYPFNGEYFQQVQPFGVWRDATKTLDIKALPNNLDTGIFGVNIHKMSKPGAKGFPVNNWSEGCQGAQEPDFIILLPTIREAVSRYGDKFTGTILETVDFK